MTSLLRMRGIEKRFGGVHALRGVDFDLAAGEVHVLLGENGAGKSTLMGVLSGAVSPDAGTVEIDGKLGAFASPRDAHAAGIAMIPQELDLVPGLDIAANLFLGTERTRGGVLNHRRMRAEAQELLRPAGGARGAAGRPSPHRRRRSYDSQRCGVVPLCRDEELKHETNDRAAPDVPESGGPQSGR